MWDTIKDIILAACDTIDEDKLTPEARLVEDLNISSLEALSIFSDLEDEFDIKISNKESRKLITLGDLKALVEEKA